MINGVLVERTVKDVVPALKTNSEGLRKVLEDLVKQYNSKQTEMEKWKARQDSGFNIRWLKTDFTCYTEKEQHSGCPAIEHPIYHGEEYWSHVRKRHLERGRVRL